MKTLTLIVLSLALMAAVPFIALADSRGGGHGHGWGHEWSNGAPRGQDNHHGDNRDFGRSQGNDADRGGHHDADNVHHGWHAGGTGTTDPGTGSTDPGTGSTDGGKGGSGGGIVSTK